MTADRQTLLGLPLFAGLSDDDMLVLEPYTTAERHARSGLVFRRGDHGDALYIVLDGQVMIEAPRAGRTELLGVCGPGDWFGELALLTGAPRTADARIALDAVLLRIERVGWTALSLHAPQVFARLCERLGRQLGAAMQPEPQGRRQVIGYHASADALVAIERSLRRQFPRRELHVITSAGTAERVLASIVARDAVVLLAVEERLALADRRLEQVGPDEWRLDPPHGAERGAVIRGRSEDETIDRVARHIAGGTIGLALGAGGAFGYAHLGLLRVLDAAGIPVDYVAGTSMGAIVGAALAAGAPIEQLVDFACRTSADYRSVVLRDLDFTGPGWLRGDAVLRTLAGIEELASATFDSLLLPFVAVAMDLGTGAEIIIDEGPVLDGIRPSFAMPGIFGPQVRGEHVLVDGAMVDPVPVEPLRALGADFVIAAQPIPPLRPVARDPLGGFFGKLRWIVDWLPLGRMRGSVDQLDTTVRSFQAVWYELANLRTLAADVTVRPDLQDFWFLQFSAAAPIISIGEQAGMACLDALRAKLRERIGWDADAMRGGG